MGVSVAKRSRAVSSGGSEPSRAVLSELPVRALFFLRGVSNYSAIRSTLAKVGFGELEHNEGWALLSRAFSYGPFSDAEGGRRVRAAQDEIDSWMSKHHDRLAM